MLVSVAVATVLVYPIPFLFTTDLANGASNLPAHVWTAAQPVDHHLAAASAVEPDVIMRSVWVHGSYMDALNKNVLLDALQLQDRLLGSTESFEPKLRQNADEILSAVSSLSLSYMPSSSAVYPSMPSLRATADDGDDDDNDTSAMYYTLDRAARDRLHVINGLSNESWFFHSPLLYWSCSADNIAADNDILSTVNKRKDQPTSVNVTLRHSIVFSGKCFADRRLLTADALVITLIHLRDSPVARRWIDRARSLPRSIADKWDVYPPDGYSASSRLYEFQFRPISLQDSVLLTLAYALTLAYCLVSLSKIRAVKSKIGLIITVVTQIIVSIMSSFTVCAVLDVDLSRIPRAAYPLIVLALSLESSFRLINAVIVAPVDDNNNTWSRVGHAFGETVHVSLASSAQNVLILWGLSHVVYPGVSAFCIFAIFVVIFDFFYHSTFFLSVLSIDVRRTELGDALAKSWLKHARRRDGRGRPVSIPCPSWTESLLQGDIALSTRISGTIVTVAFVLIAQAHFLGGGSLVRLFSMGQSGMDEDGSNFEAGQDTPTVQPWPLGDIHQARSPTSWLRLQDHETAREVIHVVKPHAHSYVARVYEPLVFVAKGADRMPTGHQGWLPPAAYDFLHHQAAQFIVIIVVALAAIRLLTNYLLWEAEPDLRDRHASSHSTDQQLSVKLLGARHHLDIARMVASPDGHIVTIGLDRRIHVWDAQSGEHRYEIPPPGNPEDPPLFLPFEAMAIDDGSRWLAILSASHVLLWSFTERVWAPPKAYRMPSQDKSDVFSFVSMVAAAPASPTTMAFPATAVSTLALVLVLRSGALKQIWPAVSSHKVDHVVSESMLSCAVVMQQQQQQQQNILCQHSPHQPHQQQSDASTEVSVIISASVDGRICVTSSVGGAWTSRTLCGGEEYKGVHQLFGVSLFGAVLAASRTTVKFLDIKSGQTLHSLAAGSMLPKSLQVVCPRRPLSQPGLSLMLAYTTEAGDCFTWSYIYPGPDNTGDTEQLDKGINVMLAPWTDATQITRRHESLGSWILLSSGQIVGIRKQARTPITESRPESILRHRRPAVSLQSHHSSMLLDWQAYLVAPPTKPNALETRALIAPDESYRYLVIADLGPLVRVGRNSVATAFGTAVIVVSVGRDHSVVVGGDEEEVDSRRVVGVGSRRKKGGGQRKGGDGG